MIQLFFDLKYSFEKIFTFQSSAKEQRMRAKTPTFQDSNEELDD